MAWIDPIRIEDHEVEHAAAAVSDLTALADAPAELAGQPGLVSGRTGLGWLALVPCFAAISQGGLAAAIGILLTLVVVIVAVLSLVRDVTRPAVRGRKTPEAALRCYLENLRFGRWRAAHATLSAHARSAPVRVPEIPALGTSDAEASFETPAGLKAYWQRLAVRSFRSISRVQVSGARGAGPVQVRRVMVEVTAYPLWTVLALVLGIFPGVALMFIFGRTWPTAYDAVVFKHRSQWWLYSGELRIADRTQPGQ